LTSSAPPALGVCGGIFGNEESADTALALFSDDEDDDEEEEEEIDAEDDDGGGICADDDDDDETVAVAKASSTFADCDADAPLSIANTFSPSNLFSAA